MAEPPKKPKRKPPTGPTRKVLERLRDTLRDRMNGAQKAGLAQRADAFGLAHLEVLLEIRKLDLKPKRGRKKPSREQ